MYICYDQQHLIWGTGETPEAARADAAVFLRNAVDDPAAEAATYATCPATERLVAEVEHGRLAWNLDTTLADVEKD